MPDMDHTRLAATLRPLSMSTLTACPCCSPRQPTWRFGNFHCTTALGCGQLARPEPTAPRKPFGDQRASSVISPATRSWARLCGSRLRIASAAVWLVLSPKARISVHWPEPFDLFLVQKAGELRDMARIGGQVKWELGRIGGMFRGERLVGEGSCPTQYLDSYGHFKFGLRFNNRVCVDCTLKEQGRKELRFCMQYPPCLPAAFRAAAIGWHEATTMVTRARSGSLCFSPALTNQ